MQKEEKIRETKKPEIIVFVVTFKKYSLFKI